MLLHTKKQMELVKNIQPVVKDQDGDIAAPVGN